MTGRLPQPGAWIVAVVALRSMPVGADTPDPAECDPPGWTRVGPLEGAAIGGIGVAAIVLQLFVNAPRSPRWDKPILLDQPIQDALRASSPGGRSRAATASDVAGAAFLLYPVVVDAGLVTWLGHGSGNLALRLAAIDVEALAVAGLVTVALQKSVGRVRPFARACAAGSVPGCVLSPDENTSFVSGHASLAFAAASTLCMQHARLPLYGSGDAFVCPLAVGVAAGISVLRIVSDRHWASDVLAGAALGTTVGAVVSSVQLRDGAPTQRGFSIGAGGRAITYAGSF